MGIRAWKEFHPIDGYDRRKDLRPEDGAVQFDSVHTWLEC